MAEAVETWRERMAVFLAKLGSMVDLELLTAMQENDPSKMPALEVSALLAWMAVLRELSQVVQLQELSARTLALAEAGLLDRAAMADLERAALAIGGGVPATPVRARRRRRAKAAPK